MGLFDRFFGTPGKEPFAHLMAAAICEAGETAKLRYDAEQFSLITEEGPANTFYLANAYAEYCAAPKAGRPDVVRRFVRSWFSPRKGVPDDFADARTDLLPGLRNRFSFELTPLRMRAEDKGETAWPYRVLAGHLGVGLVYDLPESMMQLQENTLAKWGVTLDEALAVACDNLRQISGRDFEQPSPGVWLSPWRDNYDAARLTVPELLRRHEVKGDLIAAVPNRDVLLLTGSDDESGLEYLLAQVEEYMQKPRPLSAIPIRLDGDTWLPYHPDPDSPLYARFRMLSVQSAGQDYTEQGEVLQALHERTGEDVFVASYTAMRRKDEVVSYCVWSEGVDSLLPRTDEIYFFRPVEGGEGEIVGGASWDAVAKAVGGLLEPCGLYPERYRVRAFPASEQLAAIVDPKEGGLGA